MKRTRTTASQMSADTDVRVITFSGALLDVDLVLDNIFDFASPGTLFCFKRTCKRAKTAVESYFRRAFNINRHLSQFFDNPHDFRSLQARTCTLISGSNALQFFNRVRYEGSDLDLYAYYEHRLEVGHWLIRNGFAFQPASWQNKNFDIASRDCKHTREPDTSGERLKYHTQGVIAVFTFTKDHPKEAGAELKVQVVVALKAPMDVVMDFHSTAVLNVIAWDRAYSLYPRATFEDRKSLYLRTYYAEDKDERRVVNKYKKRGWSFYMSRSQFDQDDRAFSDAARWIGDSQSWVIKHNLKGVTPPGPVNEFSKPLSRDPCCLASWYLRPEDDEKFIPVPPKLERDIQRSKFLFYKYVTIFDSDPDSRSWFFPGNCQAYRFALAGLLQSQVVEGKHFFDNRMVEYVQDYLEVGEIWRNWPPLPENSEYGSDSEADSLDLYLD